jgi:hypothetical protein
MNTLYKVRKIAAIIGRDPDELLALGRVASDLTDIIRQRPTGAGSPSRSPTSGRDRHAADEGDDPAR